MNRLLGEPALGRHVREYYQGVVMDDVQERMVDIKYLLTGRERVNKRKLVNELVGYMEYYADNLDFMTEAVKFMSSFRYNGNVWPLVRHNTLLRVLPFILQATCNHTAELGLFFCRLIWDTFDDSRTYIPEKRSRFLLTQVLAMLVNGGAVPVLVRMAHDMEPYLEHLPDDPYDVAEAYAAMRGLMWDISVLLPRDGSSRNLRSQLNGAIRSLDFF